MADMNPKTNTLRPYQVRLVTDVCRTRDDVLVEQPTGSGKTVQIVTLVAMQLGRRFTHAVISAPQEQIERGFVQRDYQAIASPDCTGVAVPAIETPAALIKGARDSKLGSVKRVIHYLRQPEPLGHAFACTHAALNRLTPADLPDDLTGKALFIDEAHHASADALSQIVTLWRERRGQLFFFTATPYRGDGRPVRLDGMRSYRRSLAEHMAEGFAPGRLESEIVALGQPGDVITAGQFTGEEAPPSSYFEGLVAAICRRWVEGGKPKAIVRVPPMKGGRSGELISWLTQTLASQGARVLDATGTGAMDKKRFLDGLEAEKSRTYATSTIDVMVGIQRVLEGTDWPVCSAVYCVGIPGSLNTVVQFLGRAMRLKGEDYPAAQRDRARLVFFVPCGGGTALADLSIDHSRHALLTCCFLADHEVGQEWIVLREVRRGIEAALGSRAENPAAADAENEADEALDPEVRAEIELVMADAREQVISRGGEPKVGEVVEWAAKTRPDLPEAVIHRVAAEILAGQASSGGAAFREAIQGEIAKRLRIDPMVKKAMAEAFAVLVNEFRDATLSNSAVMESVGRQIHTVTGGQIEAFAKRLRDASPKPLTAVQILEWADAHCERTGKWPVSHSGPIADAPWETWINIDIALRTGIRDLPGGSSLAKLLAENRGKRNHLDLVPLTVEQILVWADAYYRRVERWPKKNSNPIMEAPAESWSKIDRALIQGGRGLRGGSSLSQLLAEHRGARNHMDLPGLSVEQILGWADAYFNRTGNWPRQDTGPVLEAPDVTWVAITLALRKGLRGLPGGSSLAQLLSEHRSARNHLALRSLTEQQILLWVDAHHARTGQWPNHHSGRIEEAPDESWGRVNGALARGLRGLPGGSSLAQLLAEQRAVRNLASLPSLSVDQILAWADAHHARTGRWPIRKSGVIEGAAGETWAGINTALIRGRRDLPGDSSLTQLLSDHRGVPNIQKLPRLSVSKILEWADSHYERAGKWPTSNSGQIENTLGETWVRVDAALMTGRRGLAGGSSLAILLAEHRGARNRRSLPDHTVEQILRWGAAHLQRTGKWPTADSGDVLDAPGENWKTIDQALRIGCRGLPGGSSLARLVNEYRGPLV
jgi:hypothetical protein